MRLHCRPYLGDAARFLLGFVAMVAPIAVAVALMAAGHERAVLHFGFGHVPQTLAQAVMIVSANLTVLIPFFAMAGLVQIRSACVTARGRRAFTLFCDFIVIAPVVHNLVLPVAGAVGAYGWRMIAAMLPAGPIELSAFALAASVYLRSRRAKVNAAVVEELLLMSALATLVLVLAALTETYA